MTRSVFTALLASLISMGCATMPPVGVRASGERLDVQEETHVSTSMQRQQVGSVQYTDSSGASVGSATIYKDVPVTHYERVWYVTQGNTQIDDEDFYRIAGNEGAAREAHEYRSRGMMLSNVGLGVLGLGAGVAGVGGLVRSGEVAVIGAVSALVGGTMWWVFRRWLEPEHHPFDSVTAANTANEYNRRLYAAQVEAAPVARAPPPVAPPVTSRALGAAAPPVRASPAAEASARAAALYRDGLALTAASRYAEALTALSQAIDASPNLPEPYLARGNVLIALGRNADALADYQYAMTLRPDLGAPLYGLGRAYERLGRKNEARVYFRRYLEANSSDAVWKSDVRARLAALER